MYIVFVLIDNDDNVLTVYEWFYKDIESDASINIKMLLLTIPKHSQGDYLPVCGICMTD